MFIWRTALALKVNRGFRMCRMSCSCVKHFRLVGNALGIILLALSYPIEVCQSARPAKSSSVLGGRASRSHANLATALQQRQSPVTAPEGRLNLETLQKGNVYAVNVHGSSFQLARVDVAALLRRHNARNNAHGDPLAVTASLTDALRAEQPGENVGWAWFADTYREDGWYRLEIRIDTDAPFPDVVKARAAGFVEGNLQSPALYRYWTNYRVNEYHGRGEAPSRELYDWFDEQYSWMVRRVERATGWSLALLRGNVTAATATTADAAAGAAACAGGAADPAHGGSGGGGTDGGNEGDGEVGALDRRYWSLVGLVAAQFEGLAAGFWASVADPGRNMSWHELYALNAVGDMYELNVLFPPSPAAAAAGAVRQPQQRHYTPGHGEVGEYGYGELLDCSALIKLEEGSGGWGDEDGEGDEGDEGGEERPSRGRNFWAAHNTWRSYYDMVRTWKVYDMPWGSTGAVTVSSSPGLLHSKDDWYTTDSFVVMETTNGVYNKALYDMIQPKCVLMWQRAQVANFGARSGGEWVDLFASHNSGTYNNQWMVLDVERLQRPRPRSDVLWVLEQVPGRTVSGDVTRVLLHQGYWASYNVPYFPEIYNLTGYPLPSIYSTCPRARIFSREHSRLSSRLDVMTLMRLNRYTDDPLAGGLPNNAIAARYDLPATDPPSGEPPRNWTRRAYGAVDAKVVDLESFRTRRTYVINGPTADDQPVFRWSAEPLFDDVRHDGCVDEFDFGWRAYESVVGPPHMTRAPRGAGAGRPDSGAETARRPNEEAVGVTAATV